MIEGAEKGRYKMSYYDRLIEVSLKMTRRDRIEDAISDALNACLQEAKRKGNWVDFENAINRNAIVTDYLAARFA